MSPDPLDFPNPYEPPPVKEPVRVDKSTRGGPASLVILTGVLLLTELFATINTIQEGHRLLVSEGGFLILIAGASQLPGLLIGVWRWRRNSRAVVPMLIGAYTIALTGAGVYALTAFQTAPADSMNSAAHMHVIAIPIMHCMLAVVVYGVCGIASAAFGLMWLFSRSR